MNQNGKVESSIQLTRLKKDGLNRLAEERDVLFPFFHVKRVLHLGLTWKTSTTIKRLTPTGLPVVVSIPLIKGESVTTSGIHIENGNAIINMDSETDEVYWHSNLEMASEIRLTAPQSVSWTETWMLDASPVWHCEISGINVIHHQDIQRLYRPQWQPWPGEEVIIKISRPKAVSGRMVTIDKADLILTPGKRFNKAELTLKIRTSLGGQQEIVLPDDADLQLVKIDNKSRPIRQKGNKVIIPLHPGSQNLYIQWHQLTQSLVLFKSPLVIIGNEVVNADVTINMPENRWLLFTCGPRLGPAVLFWSYLVIVIIAAFALGKFTLTPLKTYSWLLLSLGLTQVSPLVALLIAGWLIALGLRKKYMPPDNWFYFNAVQLILVIWTMAALCGLYTAIEKGLLGIPDMQISGNFSTSLHLHWTQDRIDSVMPQPMVLSLPQFIYHLLMLIWALWLAFALLKWLKWGWQSFSEGQIWKKISWRRKKPA